MIKGFADKESKRLYTTGKSRKLPADMMRQTLRKLEQINSSVKIEDIRTFPGNRFEPMKGRMKGKYSIRINDQWRVLFSFTEGDAFDVEITDYHK